MLILKQDSLKIKVKVRPEIRAMLRNSFYALLDPSNEINQK